MTDWSQYMDPWPWVAHPDYSILAVPPLVDILEDTKARDVKGSEMNDQPYKPGRQGGKKGSNYDDCQTPPYALESLLQFLPKELTKPIYDPASGAGVLARELERNGFDVIATDIKDGTDFFKIPKLSTRVIVTNPPYSMKYKWLKHCYELDQPFALLMPVEMIGTWAGQALFRKYSTKIIYMDKRVDFLMPGQMWAGRGAQFPVAWYTWKLPVPSQIYFANLNKPPRNELLVYWFRALNLGPGDEVEIVTPWYSTNGPGLISGPNGAEEKAENEIARNLRSWDHSKLLRTSSELSQRDDKYRLHYWVTED